MHFLLEKLCFRTPTRNEQPLYRMIRGKSAQVKKKKGSPPTQQAVNKPQMEQTLSPPQCVCVVCYRPIYSGRQSTPSVKLGAPTSQGHTEVFFVVVLLHLPPVVVALVFIKGSAAFSLVDFFLFCSSRTFYAHDVFASHVKIKWVVISSRAKQLPRKEKQLPEHNYKKNTTGIIYVTAVHSSPCSY